MRGLSKKVLFSMATRERPVGVVREERKRRPRGSGAPSTLESDNGSIEGAERREGAVDGEGRERERERGTSRACLLQQTRERW